MNGRCPFVVAPAFVLAVALVAGCNGANHHRLSALQHDPMVGLHPLGAKRVSFGSHLGGSAMGQAVNSSVDATYIVTQAPTTVARFYLEAAERAGWHFTTGSITCLSSGSILLRGQKNFGTALDLFSVTVDGSRVSVSLESPEAGTHSDGPAHGSTSIDTSQTCLS